LRITLNTVKSMGLPLNWLIATNGTKFAGEAVQYAARLSALTIKKPKITILVVAETEDKKENAFAIIEMAKLLFREFSDPTIQSTSLVKVGDAGKTIVDTANELNCDQILIGGGDFAWDVTKDKKNAVSNYIISNYDGVITISK